MGTSGRIVFVEQFYYPEGWGGAELPRDLTVHLVRAGFDVDVMCGSDRYAPVVGDTGVDPRLHGVNILRWPRLLRGDVHAHKLLRQLWFCVGLLPRLFLRRPPDLFVSQTNPPLAVPMVALAAHLWHRPYLLIAMDVYPEVLVAHGSLRPGQSLTRLLNCMFRRAYRAAERIVALGPVMAARLVAKGAEPDRIVEISNWSTGGEGVVRGPGNRLRAEWGLQDKFVLVYSGNLGIGHEFNTLLEAFALALGQSPDLRLVIIGKGSRRDAVVRRVDELRLAQAVRFSELLPAERLPESIGLADLAIVTLRPGFEGLIVPSKMLGYMSRGVPVLYIGPSSDVDAMIERYECGIALRNGDVAGVADAILAARRASARLLAMGESGRRGYEAHLSRDRGLARYEAIVRACLEPRSGAGPR